MAGYFAACFTSCSSLKPPLVVNFSFVQGNWRKEKKSLERDSDVVNSFARTFKQNRLVVWPGEKKEGKYLVSPAVPYKITAFYFPFSVMIL